MKEFNFNLPTEVVVGTGVYKRLDKLIKTDKKTLIVTDRGLVEAGIVEKIENILIKAGIEPEIFSNVKPNPDQELVQGLTDNMRENNIEQVIAVGGGSPIDGAKTACCLATNEGPLADYQWGDRSFASPALPLIAIPTTAGTGSEVTGVAVITSRETKKGINDREIFPRKAIVDPELMTTLPPYLTAITGMDALTHAVEAYLGLGANPMTDALAARAIELIGDYLPRAYAHGQDLEARYNMALASMLAGVAMDQAGLGIVHSLASPLCTYLHLSHGLANSILLPHGMKFNLIAREEKMARIAGILGADRELLSRREAAEMAIELVRGLQEDLGLTEKMEEVLAVEPDLEQYGQNAANMFLIRNNPRQATAEDCTQLFARIFAG